ncbi:MAG: hypothetical protein R2733_18085 [Acidimicrobiales bacterium]
MRWAGVERSTSARFAVDDIEDGCEAQLCRMAGGVIEEATSDTRASLLGIDEKTGHHGDLRR